MGVPAVNVWTWMEGRTLQRNDGTYLARMSTDETDHPAAARIGRRWELEGYGLTPEKAEADLLRRLRESDKVRP